MFGECHAHLIMDGKNYKEAVALHAGEVQDWAIRRHLEEWKEAKVTFVRDGGDAKGVSLRAKELAPEYGIDYRTPAFAIHKKGHYGGIVGLPFEDWREYRDLVRKVKQQGGSFVKIMISGIMDFGNFGTLSEPGLTEEEIRMMIDIAHDTGFAVMAHGNGPGPVSAAIGAGVDTLEHGNYLTEEVLHQLAESETIWIPTLAPTGNLLGSGRFPDEEVRQILEQQLQNVSRAFALGAHLGLGSDAGAYLVPHGQGLLDEYAYMRQAISDEKALRHSLQEAEDKIRQLF
ncbi:MAG: amidohydrolase family protein [Lachnospiraceae bacterium]|nr:amidohydrolase family protein [Lachnospiraceae bacterium]